MPAGQVSTPYHLVDVFTGIIDILFGNLVGEKLIGAFRTFAETFYRLAHTI